MRSVSCKLRHVPLDRLLVIRRQFALRYVGDIFVGLESDALRGLALIVWDLCVIRSLSVNVSSANVTSSFYYQRSSISTIIDVLNYFAFKSRFHIKLDSRH